MEEREEPTNVDEEELDELDAELLPDREAMSLITPLPDGEVILPPPID